ncbi:MAG: hypothetical protein CMM41_11395 [Rhodospirillaceae bacterium]|nr:hypothetical protein [Rhodospirillaceae bacterium]|tara:strand:- start:1589 stop:2470 length:882 start_codon:yes stop_codon:yes gene_type:complete
MIEARQKNNLHGIWLMIIGSAVLVASDAVSKVLTETYPVWQVLTLRHIGALVAILVYARLVTGWEALRVNYWPGQILRGTIFFGTAVFVIWSLQVLPLPTFTAIVFSGPFFVAALSVPLLNEQVGWRRWMAILVGFTGMLIIVRPGAQNFEWLLVLPICAAIFAAFRDIITRKISIYETSIAILFWSTIIVTFASLFAIPLGWNRLGWQDAGLFFINGILNAGAHFLIIEALRHGEAALISPFRYSALLWSILFGLVIWNHIPDTWVFVGSAVIAASGVYMIKREAHLTAKTH